jgi:hypothetical protein
MITHFTHSARLIQQAGGEAYQYGVSNCLPLRSRQLITISVI